MENKLKVVSYEIKVDYLTNGKEYDVITKYQHDKDGFWIIADGKEQCYCLWNGCQHLEGKNWIKVNPK